MSPKSKSLTPWRDKVEEPQEPKIVDVPPKMQPRFGTGRMVIATPKIIEDIIKRIPKSKLATVTQIMQKLCADFGTDSACPIITGIFLNIAAKAAEEDMARGRKDEAPYWRILKTGGALNPKYPGGMEAHARTLTREGHEVSKLRKTWKVVDFEKLLDML